VLRLALDTIGASGAVGNLNYLKFSPSSPAATPFGGTPAVIPGTVEAENFDEGGRLVAYVDTSAGNSGGQYRPNEDVDIELTTDVGGGYNVGWMSAGEWLKYTVNIAAAGSYALVARVACNGPGGTFHLELDGAPVTGALSIPNTGGWQRWIDLPATVTLPAGTHVLRLALDTIGASGAVGNINWLRFTSGVAIVPGVTNTIALSGVVTDPSGAAMPGAVIELQYLPFPASRNWSYVSATTDSGGHYTVTFDAVPDAIDGGLALASVGKAGYDGYDYQYVKIDTQAARYDFRMQSIVQISVGQTIQVTVAANDSICNNNLQDYHPWPLEYEWVCHPVRVVSSTAGTLTVQLLPNAGTTSGVQLEVSSSTYDGGFELTQSLSVEAGQLVGVSPEIPYGSGSDRTFTLVTSMSGSTGP
jgi:hypothetical protein